MCKCTCIDLDACVSVEDYKLVFDNLNPIAVGNWARLMECHHCHQLWEVAEWDRGQTQLATKIASEKRCTWEESHEEAEKMFLIRSRGGVSAEACAWANCDKPHVVGVALCVNHLYEAGFRQ